MKAAEEGHAPRRRVAALPSVRAQRDRALDARTLYLVPKHSLHVSSTGEALVATRPDGEVHRLPASRLLRVVCNERVNWSGAALALCQARGITVTWLDARGNALGHLWPAVAPRTDLADALEGLASLPGDWVHTYGNWLRRQRLTVLNRWQSERAAAQQPVVPDEWQRALRAWVYRNEIAEHLPPVLHGMISALVASRLAEMGLVTRYWCFDGQCIELAADVSRLVWAELNLCGGAIAEAMRQSLEAAALFEQWSTCCASIAQAHLTSLKAHAARELRA